MPGIDVLTRAISWLLTCGMQGLPGRAQVILMGHGELLDFSFSGLVSELRGDLAKQ